MLSLSKMNSEKAKLLLNRSPISYDVILVFSLSGVLAAFKFKAQTYKP